MTRCYAVYITRFGRGDRALEKIRALYRQARRLWWEICPFGRGAIRLGLAAAIVSGLFSLAALWLVRRGFGDGLGLLAFCRQSWECALTTAATGVICGLLCDLFLRRRE